MFVFGLIVGLVVGVVISVGVMYTIKHYKIVKKDVPTV